jgi:hypothetical protein
MSSSEIKRLQGCQKRSLELQESYHQQLNAADKRGDKKGVERYREMEMAELQEYFRLQDQIDRYAK